MEWIKRFSSETSEMKNERTEQGQVVKKSGQPDWIGFWFVFSISYVGIFSVFSSSNVGPLLNLEEVLSGKLDNGWFVQRNRAPIIPITSNLHPERKLILLFGFWHFEEIQHRAISGMDHL